MARLSSFFPSFHPIYYVLVPRTGKIKSEYRDLQVSSPIVITEPTQPVSMTGNKSLS